MASEWRRRYNAHSSSTFHEGKTMSALTRMPVGVLLILCLAVVGPACGDDEDDGRRDGGDHDHDHDHDHDDDGGEEDASASLDARFRLLMSALDLG
jgi:hypothetical protein